MAARSLQCCRYLLFEASLRSNQLLISAARGVPPCAYALGRPHVLSAWSTKLSWQGSSKGGRWFSSSSAEDEGSDGKAEGEGEEAKEQEEEEMEEDFVQQSALAPLSIPDNFPEVPVLAITRNPIFPKFVKMLEASWMCY